MQTTDSTASELSARVASLVELNNYEELSSLLNDLHAVELANVLAIYEGEQLQKILKLITGLDQLTELLTYANDQLRSLIINIIDDSRLVAAIRRMQVDDASYLLGKLTRRRQVKVLRRISPSKAKELKSLLAYEEDSAGRIMNTRFLSFPQDTSVEQAIAEIRAKLSSGDSETDLHYCYVLDSEGHTKGVFSLRELLSKSENQNVSEFMYRDIIGVEDKDDQEVAAKIIADYDISAIPVFSSENGKMLGIITIDDVIDVIEEEHTEDILKLAGTEDEDTVGATLTVALKSRMPWLLASCLGGCAGALLLGSFSETLNKMVALAFFMPVVFGMGGNVGSQASTITVRGLATGELQANRTRDRFNKEASVGLVLGLCFAALLFVVSLAIFGELKLSIIVASSISITMFCSASLGAILPVMFNKFGIDPAIASGPLVTTSSDILSGVIYFSIATALL